MKGHADMDMSIGGQGFWWQRLKTPAGQTATANYFVMDWAANWNRATGLPARTDRTTASIAPAAISRILEE
jgi:hypothetical protein